MPRGVRIATDSTDDEHCGWLATSSEGSQPPLATLQCEALADVSHLAPRGQCYGKTMTIVGKGKYQGVRCTLIEERDGYVLARMHGVGGGSGIIRLPVNHFSDHEIKPHNDLPTPVPPHSIPPPPTRAGPPPPEMNTSLAGFTQVELDRAQSALGLRRTDDWFTKMNISDLFRPQVIASTVLNNSGKSLASTVTIPYFHVLDKVTQQVHLAYHIKSSAGRVEEGKLGLKELCADKRDKKRVGKFLRITDDLDRLELVPIALAHDLRGVLMDPTESLFGHVVIIMQVVGAEVMYKRLGGNAIIKGPIGPELIAQCEQGPPM